MVSPDSHQRAGFGCATANEGAEWHSGRCHCAGTKKAPVSLFGRLSITFLHFLFHRRQGGAHSKRNDGMTVNSNGGGREEMGTR